MKNEYHYLTEFGSLKGFNKTNPSFVKKTFLVLDSSVCLDIINIVNKKSINKESRRKAFELIRYSQKKSMPPFEVLALLELSSDKSTYKLNAEKFFDFGDKLKFAFQFPLEILKKNDFNFSINFHSPKTRSINNNANPFVEQLLVHYCALLKIREIARKGLNKEKSKENIIEFFDWMNSELGLILGLEYQLAFQIFGGNNNFNTMIKENSNKEKAIKALWGTAWDLLHARVSRNSKQLAGIVSEDINSIFVTNDKKLFELLAPQIEFATQFDRSKISLTSGNENYPPHFDNEFVKSLNEKIIEIYKHRILNSVIYPDIDKVTHLITNLEKNML